MAEFRLETERLVLRAWRDDDRDHFWAMTRDSEMMRHLQPLTREQSDGAIDRQIAHQSEHGHCFWVVERKRDASAIGYCGVIPPRAPTFACELGWRFRSSVWGQGYACEAALATLDWVWTNLEAKSVVAVTNPVNSRSWGLMLRLGMARNPDEDFECPDVPANDPLRHCMVYRIERPA